VARLGGDEFVLVIPGPANGPAAIVLLEMVGQAVLEVLRAPLPLRDRVVSPRGALGLASYPEHATTPADLLKNADLALYAAKTEGRNRAVLFAPAMRASVERRVEIARQVRGAIADGMLVPYYQPKMRLETNEVVGFEALARWLHPTKGLLSPEAFATAFEDRDIAIALGERILRQVVDDLGGWIARGLEPGHAAVNLASAQFAQSDLAERILGILAAARVPPNRLMIEVTETVLLGKSADRVASVLDRLHGAGLRIALDDFGTGYASLTHLKQFPVSEIKIDRSFVRGVERNAGDAAIVAAVAQLGRNLGLDVTAEAVETDGQAQFLRQQNCTFAQGYLFAKPMAASRIPWFLAAHAETGLSRRRLA
jgi:predicted signal transduction protein with EAL and GGDEF domain